jgi:hypothetical protein
VDHVRDATQQLVDVSRLVVERDHDAQRECRLAAENQRRRGSIVHVPIFSLVRRVAPAAVLITALGAAAGVPTGAAPPAPVHGMPQILSIEMPANRDFYAGQTVHSSVVTTPNVNYVEARINYRNSPFRRESAGHFAISYTIPWWLPPWLRHAWTVQIIARSIDGVEVRQNVPIRIH